MQKCPNCGRPTARTADWACQWCGYPLLTGNYPKNPKTYRQILDERRISEADELAARPEAEAEQPPEPRFKPPQKPELRIWPVAKPAPEPEPEEPEEVEEPERIPMAKPDFESTIKRGKTEKPELSSEAKFILPSLIEPRSASKPDLMPEANLVPELKLDEDVAPVARVKPAVEPAVELEPVPPAEPPPPVDVASLLKKDVFTIEELDMIYRADKDSAEANLVNKMLTVSGVVERVFVNDGLGIHYLVLTNAQNSVSWNVRCTFEPDYIGEIKRLSPAQPLTVKGRYGGHGKNIILKDCILVRE